MTPFTLRFALSRRQRLAIEFLAWLPAVAGTVGFSVGAIYAAVYASPWFLALLALPPLAYRGLFVFAFDLVARSGLPVAVVVTGADLEVTWDGSRRVHALEGIFQVFKSGDVWTVLHLDGLSLTIPADAISAAQVEFLRGFARRGAAARLQEQR
ncbi:MAG: hypothetical protein K2V38_02620 [Gemmataceae bacterium]|nr:hypothetical protein [Gemmataceae bacterium]